MTSHGIGHFTMHVKRCVTLTPLFEMEAYGMIYNVNKFLNYILWVFVVHVNLYTFLYFFIMSTFNGNLTNWTILLQDIEFAFYTQHMHLYVSCFEFDERAKGSLDDFPIAVILWISKSENPCYNKDDPYQWISEKWFFLDQCLPLVEMTKKSKSVSPSRVVFFALLESSTTRVRIVT